MVPAATARRCESSWKIDHADRAAFADLRLDAQRQADVLALDGLERVGRAPPVPVLVNEPVTKGTFWPTTILASSLSSVTRFGVDRMLASALVSRKRASAPMFVQVADRCCRMPKFRPARQRQRGQAGAALVDGRGQVDDVAAAGRSWCRRHSWWSLFWSPEMALPLEAEVGRLVGVDLDDQRLDVDLRAARVELVDHGAQLPVQRLGAVMISELVAGSAWMKPPVDGLADAATGVVDAACAAGGRRRPRRTRLRRCRCRPRRRCAARRRRRRRRPRAARRPASPRRHSSGRPPRCCRPRCRPGVGWSSLAISDAQCASRAGLAARTISELLRGSASTVSAPPAAGSPGCARRRAAAVGQALHHRRQVGWRPRASAAPPRCRCRRAGRARR